MRAARHPKAARLLSSLVAIGLVSVWRDCPSASASVAISRVDDPTMEAPDASAYFSPLQGLTFPPETVSSRISVGGAFQEGRSIPGAPFEAEAIINKLRQVDFKRPTTAR